ncbi:hypothetical protein L0244_37385, partial [bacterium]|nr:hypothetical protein [bacterium]
MQSRQEKMKMWEKLGYKENIYFPTPLPIDDIGRKLLCGRGSEIENFILDCSSDSRILKVIGGDIGVGKTSFVNVAQYICYIPTNNDGAGVISELRLLPSFRKIEVTDDDHLESFAIKAVKALAFNINQYYCENKKSIPMALREYIDYWTRLKLELSSGGVGFGVSVIGSGGNFEKQSATYTFQDIRDPVYSFNIMLKEFLNDSGMAGVFILIDNLDTVRPNCLLRTLDEIRDSFFIIDHVYWILVGQAGLGLLINERSRRLGGYLTGTEIEITQLQPYSLLNAIREREKVFEITDLEVTQHLTKIRKASKKRSTKFEIKPPLDDVVHLKIYEFTHFELRETFRICSDITVRALDQILDFEQLSIDDALTHLVEFCNKEFSFIRLSPNQREILSAIYKDNGVSNISYHDFGYRSASGFDTLLRSLLHNGILLLKL